MDPNQLVRTSTVNTTYTSSTTSSGRTVRPSRDSFFAPTPPVRSSSLRPAPVLQITTATPIRPPVEDPEDERLRRIEEKRAIAREKGKLRQRRKRARDKAAKEVGRFDNQSSSQEGRAEGLNVSKVAPTFFTTEELLNIPHRGTSQPTPSPSSTSSFFYSPNISADSSPYWSPTSTFEPSIPSLVPLAAPISDRSGTSSVKRRKSEPEPEEFREEERPKARRTASDGVMGPLKPSTPIDSALEFSDAILDACQTVLGRMEGIGVSGEDLEGMRGAFAGIYNQWMMEKGMGDVALSTVSTVVYRVITCLTIAVIKL